MDEPHALSLAFRACSVAVEVSLAHLLSGITAMHGWVCQKETIIHALCFHPHYLVQAMSNQTKWGEKHRKIVDLVIKKHLRKFRQDQVSKVHNKTPVHLA